jgi:uncharacterized linocin/CFP29 family protein
MYEASADIFEILESHLTKIFELLMLLTKRLLKLKELKNVQTEMKDLDMQSISSSIQKVFFSL